MACQKIMCLTAAVQQNVGRSLRQAHHTIIGVCLHSTYRRMVWYCFVIHFHWRPRCERVLVIIWPCELVIILYNFSWHCESVVTITTWRRERVVTVQSLTSWTSRYRWQLDITNESLSITTWHPERVAIVDNLAFRTSRYAVQFDITNESYGVQLDIANESLCCTTWHRERVVTFATWHRERIVTFATWYRERAVMVYKLTSRTSRYGVQVGIVNESLWCTIWHRERVVMVYNLTS